MRRTRSQTCLHLRDLDLPIQVIGPLPRTPAGLTDGGAGGQPPDPRGISAKMIGKKKFAEVRARGGDRWGIRAEKDGPKPEGPGP